MANKIRVTIWNEYRHEKTDEQAKALYPNGIHATIKEFLDVNDDMEITLAALDDPDQGLPDEVLNNTDVLIWWGHMVHHEVDDALVERVRHRVYHDGMGFIPIHSGHHSKPFRSILGCSGNLAWGNNLPEVVWNLFPQHPIAEGIPASFQLESEEIYSEPFMIPQPDQLVFGAWFPNGNIFRAGVCYFRGLGKIFYFQPGHETCPSYHNPYVQKILTNAVRWAAPGKILVEDECPYIEDGLLGKND